MPNPVTITFKDGIDWRMLAEQKEELIRAVDNYPDVSGLIDVIDVIQDEAEKAGHPVVFLEEDDDD
jgi:hypothetical protein